MSDVDRARCRRTHSRSVGAVRPAARSRRGTCTAMSVGERQRVEIVRCLLQDPRLLIMDEPTSVLTPQAVRKLFETLRRLAAEGCSILYISHKLDEIRALCHTATVLRGGRVTGTCDPPRKQTNASLARMMIGRRAARTPRRARMRRATALVVQANVVARERRSVRHVASRHRLRPCMPAKSSASPAYRQRSEGVARGVVRRENATRGRTTR